MFCPKCGNPDQTPESYCRHCGVFLHDLLKPEKSPTRPEEHVRINMVFSAMTIVACFTLSALLYSILGFRANTHPLIYVTAALLMAMGIWHTQTFWRTLQLNKHFKRTIAPRELELDGRRATEKLLNGPDFENMVPASVTDPATRPLSRTSGRSST